MKITLLLIGKTTEKNIAEGVNNFSERIRKYSAFEIITLPDVKNTRNMHTQEQKTKEGVKIIQSFRSDDYIVILDEKGKEFTTIEFAGWLEKIFMLQKKRIVFVIGGSWGFPDEVYSRADIRISLSRMTFSHQVVRLLFLEQLYRVFTIIKGDPYHHE
jgi:23S rRNA (pseudouridine1915-N3)-methyltransferase